MSLAPVQEEVVMTQPKPSSGGGGGGGGGNHFKRVGSMGVTFIDSAALGVLTNINLGFSLAAALAWNEAVKFIIDKHVTIKKAKYYHVIYASVLTLLASLISVLATWIKPSIKHQNIQPVIGMR